MKRTLLLLIIATAASLCGAFAADETPKSILQQALFAEEAEGDLEGAAAGYEKLIAGYDAQREFTVAALYRLAEVRRKQERNDDAAKLYQRILVEFPDADPQVRLSTENLTAMGVELPAGESMVSPDPEEEKELRRLLTLAENKPEQVWDDVPAIYAGSSSVGKESPLENAARLGRKRVLAWLLDHAETTEHDIVAMRDRALEGAVKCDHLEIAKLLHRRGAKIEAASDGLVDAISWHRDAMAEWLIAQGVGIDTIGGGYLEAIDGSQDTHWHISSGITKGPKRLDCQISPLAAAIVVDNKPWVDRLLEAGADVNAISESGDRISALAVACWKGHAPLVEKLLKRGAAPGAVDALSEYSAGMVRNPPTRGGGWAPLHYGAGDATIVAALLKAGADPTAADSLGVTPLHVACHVGNIESAQKLIAAGAKADTFATFAGNRDPNANEHSLEATPLMLAAIFRDSEKGWALIELLMKHDADLFAENAAGETALSVCDVATTCRRLVETYVYPNTAELGGIAISVPECGLTRMFPAPPGVGETAPPLFSKAMQLWSDIEIRKTHHEFDWDELDWAHPVLRRSQDGGGFSKQVVDVLKEADYPELKWGDIIEIPLKLLPHSSRRSGSSLTGILRGMTRTGGVMQTYLPVSVREALSSEQTVDCTLVLPGDESLPIQLRGGLVSVSPFGPYQLDTVATFATPLLTGRNLSWYSRLLNMDNGQRLPMGRDGSAETVPKTGDVLTLEDDRMDGARKSEVTLIEARGKFAITTANGLSVKRPRNSSGEPVYENVAKLPTLFQLIAKGYMAQPVVGDILQIWNGSHGNGKGDHNELLAEQILHLVAEFGEGKAGTAEEHRPDAAERSEALAAFARVKKRRDIVLPHPDFSTFTIRRLLEDGSEKRIEVPLGEFIASCTDETPAAECRAKDVELQLGDMVELKAHYERLDTPWTGFTAQEARFFAKALSYRIQIKVGDAEPKPHAVVWSAPRFFDTKAGLIAMPSDENTPVTFRAGHVAMALGARFGGGGWVRDGAVIPIMVAPVGQSRQGKTRALSRRVVLPPKSR